VTIPQATTTRPTMGKISKREAKKKQKIAVGAYRLLKASQPILSREDRIAASFRPCARCLGTDNFPRRRSPQCSEGQAGRRTPDEYLRKSPLKHHACRSGIERFITLLL
jgi:hypothetical protein